MSKRKSNGFGLGDVIFNGWAGEWNCYSVVIGRTTVNGEPCYVTRTLVNEKLSPSNSYHSIYADRRQKIGKIDIVGLMGQHIEEHKKNSA